MAGSNPVQNTSGEHLLLLFGNAASPETFTASATINTTRSLDLTGKASVTEIADTIQPSLPAQTVRQIISTDLKFMGSGVADAPSLLQLIQYQQNGTAFDAKIVQNLTGAQGGWTASGGKLVITSLTVAGTRGDMETFTATFEQAYPFAFAANA